VIFNFKYLILSSAFYAAFYTDMYRTGGAIDRAPAAAYTFEVVGRFDRIDAHAADGRALPAGDALRSVDT